MAYSYPLNIVSIMHKLWWFKRLSCARSAREWAHVWTILEDNGQIYFSFQKKAFQLTWKVLPATTASSQPHHEGAQWCTSWPNGLLKVTAEKRRKTRRGARRPALPCLLLNASASACLINMLLLTWVFPRAQAPFELCLLGSSLLLLLWLSETQLPLCPRSERRYVSIQSWVIIIKSQQDSSCGEIMKPDEGEGIWLKKIR